MKIALFGYGKMGKEIEKIALERGHEIVLKIKENQEYDISKADIGIDFSVPNAALNNIVSCFKNNVPVISGTTGWLDDLDKALTICKENNVETDIFETTNYTDDLEKGMIRKTKIGNGRAFTLDEMGNPIKPTWDMIPDFVAKVHKFKPDIMIISVVEDVFDITRQLLQSVQHLKPQTLQLPQQQVNRLP